MFHHIPQLQDHLSLPARKLDLGSKQISQQTSDGTADFTGYDFGRSLAGIRLFETKENAEKVLGPAIAISKDGLHFMMIKLIIHWDMSNGQSQLS